MGQAETRDLTTREGAEALARELNDYWHQAGFPAAQHWIESMRVATQRSRGRNASERVNATETSHTIWCVRSNLVNGRPPK